MKHIEKSWMINTVKGFTYIIKGGYYLFLFVYIFINIKIVNYVDGTLFRPKILLIEQKFLISTYLINLIFLVTLERVTTLVYSHKEYFFFIILCKEQRI